MGKKSKKSKQKLTVVVQHEHAPCPFCESREIAPMVLMRDDEYYNMMILCLKCLTKFEFDMPYSDENVSKVYEIWDKRCSDGKE